MSWDSMPLITLTTAKGSSSCLRTMEILKQEVIWESYRSWSDYIGPDSMTCMNHRKISGIFGCGMVQNIKKASGVMHT